MPKVIVWAPSRSAQGWQPGCSGRLSVRLGGGNGYFQSIPYQGTIELYVRRNISFSNGGITKKKSKAHSFPRKEFKNRKIFPM